MRPSGIRNVLMLLLAAALPACWPYGFAGGGLPKHIRTVAVLPFENETASPELQRELNEQMRREIQGRLGLRDASEARADAIVRGTITRFDTDVPIAFSADPRQATSARRKLQIAVDVEIVDQTTGRVLWSRRGLTAEGEYPERGEDQGRRLAIQKLVNDMVEGAQSQW
jgi:curli biogenesis system outer membrane secretion channel CsgG